jgi:hypothetical protein
MRLSEFRSLSMAVFGEAYASTLTRELALDDCDSLTADAALDAGWAPRDVWHALCEQMSVPLDRRDGGDPRRVVPPPR